MRYQDHQRSQALREEVKKRLLGLFPKLVDLPPPLSTFRNKNVNFMAKNNGHQNSHYLENIPNFFFDCFPQKICEIESSWIVLSILYKQYFMGFLVSKISF